MGQEVSSRASQHRWYLKNKQAVAVKVAAYRKKHGTRLKKYQRLWELARRVHVLKHYGGGKLKCTCCGEKHPEFLTLDHVNGGGAMHRRLLAAETASGKLSGSAIIKWIVKNIYPKGFRTLCMNCNFSHGARGYCPHGSKGAKTKMLLEIAEATCE